MIVIRLDPRLLTNPDADIRYRLPELLVQRSEGILTDDGYDYLGDGHSLVLFLKTTQLESGLACVLELIEHVRVLGNDLRGAAVVAVERESGFEVVYPLNFMEPFGLE